MSRRGNCWDNAPQESFYGHMKDHIKTKLMEFIEFAQVQTIIEKNCVYKYGRIIILCPISGVYILKGCLKMRHP